MGNGNANSTEIFDIVEATKKGRIPDLATRRAALTEFMQRPWFHRLWIVQEALLSDLIVLQCENHTMDFQDLVNIYEDVTNDRKISGSLLLRPECTIPELRRWYLQQLPASQQERQKSLERLTRQAPPDKLPPVGTLDYDILFEVMSAVQRYGCGNPRDRLFAILSLFDGPVPDLLRPDYTAEVWQIIERTSQYLCHNDAAREDGSNQSI